MKKFLLTLALSVFAFNQGMQAQSVTDITGKYIGELYIAVGEDLNDESEPMLNQTVDLTISETTGAIDFALYNFNFNGAPLGDIVLPSIGVNFGTDVTTFAENEKRELSFLEGAIEATANLNPNSSYVKGDSLIAFVDVMWTNNSPEVPINVLFKGKKLQAVDFTEFAGKYIGRLTIYNEDGSAEIGSYDSIPLTLSGINSNDATLSFGNPTLLGTEWSDMTFIPSFVVGSENVGILQSEKIYHFASVDGTKNLMAMTVQDGTILSENGLTFNFMLADEEEQVYLCSYTASLTVPAGINHATVQTKQKSDGIYTLNGLRLPTLNVSKQNKGIYIINGKKVVIK